MANFKTRHIPLVDSTHRMLVEQTVQNPELFILRASEQFNGKGSGNRRWWSPPGGLYMSAAMPLQPFLRNEERKERHVTLMCAMMMRDVLKQRFSSELNGSPMAVCGVNDLIVDGCKIGGVIAQGLSNGYVVISAGVNFNIIEDVPDWMGRPVGAIFTPELDLDDVAYQIADYWYEIVSAERETTNLTVA